MCTIKCCNMVVIKLHVCVYTELFVVDGGWSNWTLWTSCTVPCGEGTRERSRECNNPPPQYGGNDCEGSSSETCFCNSQPCPGKPFSKTKVSLRSPLIRVNFLDLSVKHLIETKHLAFIIKC